MTAQVNEVDQDQVAASLGAAIEQVRDELRRADAKATALTGLVSGVFAGSIALTRVGLPVGSQVLLWIAAAPIAASAVLLLATILPFLGHGEPGSFLHAARATPHALVALHGNTAASPLRLAVTLATVSRIARRKYRRIRVAVLLLISGITVLLLALATAALLPH